LKKKIFIILLIAIITINSFNSIQKTSAYANYPFAREDAIIQDAISWLKEQQNSDGSIGGAFASNWVLRNIAYAGENPNEWRLNSASSSLVEYVKSQSPTAPYNAEDAYNIESLILSLISAGEDPRSSMGMNWVEILKTTPIYNNNQMGSVDFINDDCWGIIALIAADEESSNQVIQDCIRVINETKIVIAYNQYAWAYNTDPAWVSVDDTSIAIIALVSAGLPQDDKLIQFGLNWLDSQQITSNGGFGFFGSISADSTAFAIQAIIASGENPNSGRWIKGTNSPIDAMFIEDVTYNFEQNAFGYALNNTFYASEYTTGNALSALIGKPYPLFKGERINIRIEGPLKSVWNGEIFVSSSFLKDEDGNSISSNPSSGREYYKPTVIGALDEASVEKPFSYTISKSYLPNIYVNEIDGFIETGSEGWNFRINGALPGSIDAGQAIIQSDHEEILWFYGDGSELVLKIEADKTEINEGESVTVGVYYYDQQGNPHPAGPSTSTSIFLALNGENHQLNETGHFVITNLEFGNYEIYAIGDGYVPSNKLLIRSQYIGNSSQDNENDFPLNSNDVQIINALQYFNNVQDVNGSIGGFSTSCWSTVAISSAGYDPRDWKINESSVVSYIINNRDKIDENKITDIAKFVLAMTSIGENPRNIGGTDYISMLEEKHINGQFGDESTYNEDFWAIIALISAGKDPNSSLIQSTVSFIKNHQNSDGGWSWHSNESDVDDTAAAIIALRAVGEDIESSRITNAINYLKNQLDSNGGFEFMGEANSASDSWAIMALVSSNINPTDSDWIKNGSSPVDHLLNLQNSNGSFSYKAGENGNAWWTAYAIPALLGKPYPIIGIPTSNKAYVRIEDFNMTVWRGWVEIPDTLTIRCYNSDKEYNITGKNVLALLDKASEIGGFEYKVSDQWYPDIGFYVDSINGHSVEGEYGWMYRLNYHTGDSSMDKYNVSSQDHILIYWGTQGIKPLRLEVDIVEAKSNQIFTATVKFFDDVSREWSPLEGAIIYANPEYITNSEGKVTIALSDIQVYGIYAAKWGTTPEEQFITSDVVQVGVGVPIPEFSSLLPLLASLLIMLSLILFKKDSFKEKLGTIQ
jgi:prenyltransferase beta subunit